MAAGARERLGADVGVAVTGVAGPDGGTQEKPVGLVYFHASTPDGERGGEFALPGDRDAVRSRATVAALHLVRRASDTESARRRMTSAGSVGGDERLRLFLALALPAAMLDELAEWQARRTCGRRPRRPARRTCTSRSRSSAAARQRSVDAIVRALREAAAAGRRRSCSSPRATARRAASGCSSSPTTTARAARLAGRCHARPGDARRLRPERAAVAAARHACCASASGRGCGPRCPALGHVRSVRRGCLPFSTAPDRGAVRGAGTRLADRRRMIRWIARKHSTSHSARSSGSSARAR